MGSFLLLFLLFSASLTIICDGGKVLVFPIDGSHWINMKILVEELHSQGHQITVIRSSKSWYISEFSPYYTSITMTQDEPHLIESQDLMTTFMQRAFVIRRHKGSLWAFLEIYRDLFNVLGETQENMVKQVIDIFENKTRMKELQETGFDVCLTDPAFPGGVLLARHLQLPVVLNVRWLFNGEGHFAIAPSPLSYVPQLLSEYTDKMNFFQRAVNIIRHNILVYMRDYVVSPPYQKLCNRYFGPGVSIMSLIQEADIWLMRVDFIFEFPRPTMPNVVYIGGFQGRPSSPLPSDLEEFVQSSGKHGVVIMTLGTLLGDLGPEISEIFASAFARIPQKVIWRHIGKRPKTLGNNTMVVKWLPQNDLLGHPKTKLFIAHGGTNGLYEAIYHGVPVLGVPLIFDQFDNILRMKTRGVAEMVEVTDLDVESLTSALNNILDPKQPYKQNMQKLSQIHHDKPMKPLDSAIFWIEYVMRHKGASHLRTESHKLPWYSYHCLDVMALFVALALLIIALGWVSCRCVLRCLTRVMKSTFKSKSE